ncbi:MAG TPA: hydrolase [Burkholderiaceae bacterium]
MTTDSASSLSLRANATALVLIDLQQGILGYARAPYTAPEVLVRAGRLVEAFHAAGASVVRVKVGWSADGGDVLRQPVDMPGPDNALPDDWLAEPPGLPSRPTDIRVLKRQWGAFTGTDLDLQLRRRGVRTLVLGGIATSIGVESTARVAWELGYEIVFAEDATSGPSAASHAHSFGAIFPRLGRVRSTGQVLEALRGA